MKKNHVFFFGLNEEGDAFGFYNLNLNLKISLFYTVAVFFFNIGEILK